MLVKKIRFIKKEGLLVSAREKIINTFKEKMLLTKYPKPEPEQKSELTVFATPKPTKERAKKYGRQYKDYFNKIAHDERNINIEIFNEYFKYYNPTLIELRNTVNRKKTSKN